MIPRKAPALGRAAAIYGLGTVLSRLVAFIMLPVYTRVLTPADFGLIQMLELTLEVMGILLSAGTTLGVMRYYFQENSPAGRGAVVSSAWVLLLGLNIIGTTILVFLAPMIWTDVLNGAGTVDLVYIAAVNFTLSALPVVPLLLLQVEQRPLFFLIASTGKLVLQLSMNIVFVVWMDMGPRGVLLSTALANIVVGAILCGWMVARIGIHPTVAMSRRLQRFGWPHQLAAAAMFILAYGDRWFLQSYRGLAAVGIYGLAYQFGFLLSNLGSASFLQAWTPQRFQLMTAERTERDARYRQGMTYLTLVNATLFVGIGLLCRPLLTVMSAPAFRIAADVVPILLLCYVLQGWTAAVHFGIDVSERSVYSGYANWIAAVITLVAYALLIPPYGGFGAAVATLIGFVARFSLVYFFAHRLWPVSYAWRDNIRLVAFATVIVACGVPLRAASLAGQLAGAAALLAIYTAIVWTAFLGASMRHRIVARLRLPMPLAGTRGAES